MERVKGIEPSRAFPYFTGVLCKSANESANNSKTFHDVILILGDHSQCYFATNQ